MRIHNLSGIHHVRWRGKLSRDGNLYGDTLVPWYTNLHRAEYLQGCPDLRWNVHLPGWTHVHRNGDLRRNGDVYGGACYLL